MAKLKSWAEVSKRLKGQIAQAKPANDKTLGPAHARASAKEEKLRGQLAQAKAGLKQWADDRAAKEKAVGAAEKKVAEVKDRQAKLSEARVLSQKAIASGKPEDHAAAAKASKELGLKAATKLHEGRAGSAPEKTEETKVGRMTVQHERAGLSHVYVKGHDDEGRERDQYAGSFDHEGFKPAKSGPGTSDKERDEAKAAHDKVQDEYKRDEQGRFSS